MNHIVLNDNVDEIYENVNKFQIAKVQSQGVAWHFLTFLPISAWLLVKKRVTLPS